MGLPDRHQENILLSVSSFNRANYFQIECIIRGSIERDIVAALECHSCPVVIIVFSNSLLLCNLRIVIIPTKPRPSVKKSLREDLRNSQGHGLRGFKVVTLILDLYYNVFFFKSQASAFERSKYGAIL